MIIQQTKSAQLASNGMTLPTYEAVQNGIIGFGSTHHEAIVDCVDEMLKVDARRMNVHND